MSCITRRQFVEMVKTIKNNPDNESALYSMTDDLGYIECLANLVSDEALDAFAHEDGPIFKEGGINWPPPRTPTEVANNGEGNAPKQEP